MDYKKKKRRRLDVKKQRERREGVREWTPMDLLVKSEQGRLPLYTQAGAESDRESEQSDSGRGRGPGLATKKEEYVGFKKMKPVDEDLILSEGSQ